METNEISYEIKVTKKYRVRRELNEWVKIREPYKDEEGKFASSRVRNETDPQYDHRRFLKDVEISEEVFTQKVDELDMSALVQVINKISK